MQVTDVRTDEIDAILEDIVDGNVRLLLVEGPTGSGKTRKLDYLLSWGRSRNYPVMLVRCSWNERDVTFSVVHQLLESGGGSDDVADDLRPSIGEPVALRQELFRSWYEMLKARADQTQGGAGLLLVVIDDVHLADSVSLEWLAYLSLRIDRLAACLVVAREPDSSASAGALVANMAAHPAFRRVSLAPLTLPEVRGLIDDSLGGHVDHAFAVACHALTRGNQQLVSGLISLLAARGVQPCASSVNDVAEAFAQLLQTQVPGWLHREPTAVLRVAEAIAVLGDHATHDLIAEVSGCSGFEVLSSLTRLRALHLLTAADRIAFSHPAIPQAVIGMRDPDASAAAYLTAVRALRRRGASSPELAPYIEHLAPLGEAWAGQVLHEAGVVAARSGRKTEGIQLLLRALLEPLEAAARTRVLVDLALIQVSDGHGGATQQLNEAFGLVRTALERATVVIRLSYLLHEPDSNCGMTAFLERSAAELAGLAGDREREMRLRLQAQVVFHAYCCPSAIPTAVRLAALTADAAVPPASTLTAGEQQLASAVIFFQSAALARPAREVEAAVDRLLAQGFTGADGGTVFVLLAVSALTMAGAFGTATRLLERPGLITGCSHNGMLEGVFRHVEANLLRSRGELSAADSAAARAVALLRSSDPQDLMVSVAAAHRAECLLELGHDDEAGAILRERAGKKCASWAKGPLLVAWARLRLQNDDPRGALADVQEAAAHVAAWPFRNPAALSWRAVAATAHARLGEREAATALAREELELARRWGAPHVVSAAARVAGTVLGGDEGLLLLREAVELTRDTPARLEAAHALVALGRAERRIKQHQVDKGTRPAGRSESARAHLLAGLDLADACGARPVADAAYVDLLAIGTRPRRRRVNGPMALTTAERRVASLAALGESNRAIAEQLFVSQRAVEKLLTSVYRKLGISGRLQLADTLVSHGQRP